MHSDQVSVAFQESAPQSEGGVPACGSADARGQGPGASSGAGPDPWPLTPDPWPLREHPAVQAWRELQPRRVEPESIETLQHRNKSAIYRLEGVGPGGSAVIAKRCRQVTALVERAIYEDILPHLPIPSLHYYGFVEEEGPFCWLFLEDAGGEKYSPSIREHCVLAGRWLGRMHTSAARIAAAARLPDRGPSHYLEPLR